MGIYPNNAVANALVYHLIECQLSKEADPRDDVLACAVEIHKGLQKAKDPKYVEDVVTDFAKMQSDNAWNKMAPGAPIQGCLFVNTNKYVLGCSGLNRC